MSDARFAHFLNELTAWSADPMPCHTPPPDHTGLTSATRREALLTKVRSRLSSGDGMSEQGLAPCDAGEQEDDALDFIDTVPVRY